MSQAEIVTTAQLRAIDYADLLDGALTDHEIAGRFRSLCGEAEAAKSPQAPTFRLLATISSMHFQPEDQADPFGPMFKGQGGRSFIPEDLSEAQRQELCDATGYFDHPALQAWICDMLWTLDRSKSKIAARAISAYENSIERLILPSSGDVRMHYAIDSIRRLLHLIRLTGSKAYRISRARTTTKKLIEAALEASRFYDLKVVCGLAVQYGLRKPKAAAEVLRNQAALASDPFAQEALYVAAAQHFRRARNDEAANACQAEAAERLAAAARTAGSPMIGANWMARAIATYPRTKGARTRKAELQKELIDIQSRVTDEMGVISHETDISDLVKDTVDRLSGVSSPECLRVFSLLGKPDHPSKLKSQIKAKRSKFQLSSLFPMVNVNSFGHVKYQAPSALDADNLDESFRAEIERDKGFHRQLMVAAVIHPAISKIQEQQPLTYRDFVPLCEMSPFVPDAHVGVFATGFGRYFAGDFISASSILIPQVENSLRYILVSMGEDVTKLFDDGRQEFLLLSPLLRKFRLELQKALGEATLYEIESLFEHRAGPNLRNDVAHGTVPTYGFSSHDFIYAGWFVLYLTCFHLHAHWDEVQAYYETTQRARGVSQPSARRR